MTVTQTIPSPFNVSAAKSAKLLPKLPSLDVKDAEALKAFSGPTDWSNWVIPGRLIAGAYPATPDDAETERVLNILLELGINTFVCLQAEFKLEAAEEDWRNNKALRPYIYDAQKLLVKARKTNNERIKQDRLDFLHLPIIDGNVTSDSAISRLADDCCQRILNGERLYVHCWGGHGRTGSLICLMLSRLYGLSTGQTLAYTQALHDTRVYPQNVRSPQTRVQAVQVSRILSTEPIGARGNRFQWPTSPLSGEIIGSSSSSAATVLVTTSSKTVTKNDELLSDGEDDLIPTAMDVEPMAAREHKVL